MKQLNQPNDSESISPSEESSLAERNAETAKSTWSTVIMIIVFSICAFFLLAVFYALMYVFI